MSNSPPPGSGGPLERLLESLNRLGERLQSVVAAAFPDNADRSFLSGTEEGLAEGGELGEGQRLNTEINSADIDETVAAPNTEFPLDGMDDGSIQVGDPIQTSSSRATTEPEAREGVQSVSGQSSQGTGGASRQRFRLRQRFRSRSRAFNGTNTRANAEPTPEPTPTNAPEPTP